MEIPPDRYCGGPRGGIGGLGPSVGGYFADEERFQFTKGLRSGWINTLLVLY